jgi:hypothetical protein
MRHALQCVRNAFGDDNLEIFVKKNVDSLEKGATDLLKLTIEQHLKIENLKAQVVLLEVSQAKLSQRCFLELWEDGIRQTDPGEQGIIILRLLVDQKLKSVLFQKSTASSDFQRTQRPQIRSQDPRSTAGRLYGTVACW